MQPTRGPNPPSTFQIRMSALSRIKSLRPVPQRWLLRVVAVPVKVEDHLDPPNAIISVVAHPLGLVTAPLRVRNRLVVAINARLRLTTETVHPIVDPCHLEESRAALHAHRPVIDQRLRRILIVLPPLVLWTKRLAPLLFLRSPPPQLS